jgi:hypothetical protein
MPHAGWGGHCLLGVALRGLPGGAFFSNCAASPSQKTFLLGIRKLMV